MKTKLVGFVIVAAAVLAVVLQPQAEARQGRNFYCCNPLGFRQYLPQGCNPPGQENCLGTCWENYITCTDNGNCTPE